MATSSNDKIIVFLVLMLVVVLGFIYFYSSSRSLSFGGSTTIYTSVPITALPQGQRSYYNTTSTNGTLLQGVFVYLDEYPNGTLVSATYCDQSYGPCNFFDVNDVWRYHQAVPGGNMAIYMSQNGQGYQLIQTGCGGLQSACIQNFMVYPNTQYSIISCEIGYTPSGNPIYCTNPAIFST